MTIQLATRVHTQDKNQAVKVWEESKKYRANREGIKTAALEEKNGCCVQARAKGTAYSWLILFGGCHLMCIKMSYKRDFCLLMTTELRMEILPRRVGFW